MRKGTNGNGDRVVSTQLHLSGLCPVWSECCSNKCLGIVKKKKKKPKSEMGVKLEVFRMSLYLTFPVVMFWISNQAEWFEDYVVQRKRELWPREKEGQRQELEEFKQKIRKQKEERLLQAAQQSS